MMPRSISTKLATRCSARAVPTAGARLLIDITHARARHRAVGHHPADVPQLHMMQAAAARVLAPAARAQTMQRSRRRLWRGNGVWWKVSEGANDKVRHIVILVAEKENMQSHVRVAKCAAKG
jgi:hypothetical protein